MKKPKQRTLADCMSEARREFPYLTRAQRREVARHLRVLSRIDVLRSEIGDEAVSDLLAKAAVKIREKINQK
jgi:hypothetical protein